MPDRPTRICVTCGEGSRNGMAIVHKRDCPDAEIYVVDGMRYRLAWLPKRPRICAFCREEAPGERVYGRLIEGCMPEIHPICDCCWRRGANVLNAIIDAGFKPLD